MFRLGCVALAGAVLLLAAPAAKAATYTFTFDSEGDALHDYTITGSLTTNDVPVAPGAYAITSIGGHIEYYGVTAFGYNSDIVALIPAVSPFPFTTPHDNILYYPGSIGYYLDGAGLAFVDTLGYLYRIWGQHDPQPAQVDPMEVSIFQLDLIQGELDVQATPIPGALPLFATGLGVMTVLVRRRKRRAAAKFA